MRGFRVAALRLAHGAVKAVERDELQGVDADPVAHFLFRHRRGEKLGAFGRIDPVETRPGGGGGGDAEMDLGRACIKDHVLDLAAGGPAHDGIVDQDHPLALDERAVDVQLQPHAHVADLLRRLDEGAAHVLIADDPHAEGDAAFGGKADGGGGAAVGDGADQIGLHRRLARQFHADLAAGFIDRTAAEDRIGAREIDVFEDAESAFGRGERVGGGDGAVLDHHHLARLDLAHELRADDVQRAGFG